MDWLLGILALVGGLALLYFVIDRKYKQAVIIDLVLWIVVVIYASSMGFRLDNPSTYLSVGVFIALLGKLWLFIKKH